MSLLDSFLSTTEWVEADVVEHFLKPIGMEFLAKAFIENKISGTVLMALTEDHMKEMGCAVLGKYSHYKRNCYSKDITIYLKSYLIYDLFVIVSVVVVY